MLWLPREHIGELREAAAAVDLPDNLVDQVRAGLNQERELSWDKAVATIAGQDDVDRQALALRPKIITPDWDVLRSTEQTS